MAMQTNNNHHKDNNTIIKVIGVGGGGCNAVNHMFKLGIVGVNFLVCNTDSQALDQSGVPVKVQLGPGLTDGRGGSNMDGKPESWWHLARRAQRARARQNVPRLIEVSHSREFTLHRITLRNAANFHVTASQVDGFTAWGVRIDTPASSSGSATPISPRR